MISSRDKAQKHDSRESDPTPYQARELLRSFVDGIAGDSGSDSDSPDYLLVQTKQPDAQLPKASELKAEGIYVHLHRY